MIQSFYLSLFIFFVLLFEIIFFYKYDFTFPKKERAKNISNGIAITALIGAIILFSLAAWLVITQAGLQVLQYFYYILFTLGFILNLIFLFSKTKRNFIFILIFTTVILFLVIHFHWQLLENLFMALSLVWIGPLLTDKYNMPIKYFVIIAGLFIVIDIYNIYLTHSLTTTLDQNLLLNGMITFGIWSLGIGDLLLAYPVIAFMYRRSALFPAILGALLISFARFFIRLLLPNYNHDIPYTVIIFCVLLLTLLFNRFAMSRFGSQT